MTRRALLWASVMVFVLLMGCALDGRGPVDPRPVDLDLSQIADRDTLRVITRNHPLTYYLYKGTRRGFDFELIQRFAEEQDLVVEVVLPPTVNDMIPWLLAGKGDVIAAELTITPERGQRVSFTRSYQEVQQVAVGRQDRPPPRSVAELAGRTILIRRGTSYDENLLALRDSTGMKFDIVYEDERKEIEDPIQLVANGRASLTVVDNTIAHLEQQYIPELELGVVLSAPQQVAWAVRPNSPELLAALNGFLGRYDRSAFFNILKKRYFEDSRRFRIHRTAQISQNQEGCLSRYDDYFHEAELETGIDWRLLAAQAYHESRFHSDKISLAGAVGLMQLMPETAAIIGVGDLYDPEQNILGGARYLQQLLDMVDENLGEDAGDFRNQISFALAAYNAGMGHVINARSLVRELGGNPDDWDQVADALVLLERPEYSTRPGYAFVRGEQVRRYVYDILYRYDIFCDIIDREPKTVRQGDTALALSSL